METQEVTITYLGYKRDQFSEMLGLFIWVDLKDLTDAVIMIPLLNEFFLVSSWISLYQILKLGQICSEQDTTAHVDHREQRRKNSRRLLPS